MSIPSLSTPAPWLQQSGAAPAAPIVSPSARTMNVDPAVIVYDNVKYTKQLTSQLPAPDNRVVRNLRSSITVLLDLDERRRVALIAALVTIRRRAIDICLRAATAIRRIVAPVVIAGLLCAGPQPVALLAAHSATSIDTQPLVEASRRKEQSMVLPPHTQAVVLPPSPLVTQQAVAPRFWSGRSPTPGLSEMIDTKETAAILSAARKANSPYLIDGSRVKLQKAQA